MQTAETVHKNEGCQGNFLPSLILRPWATQEALGLRCCCKSWEELPTSPKIYHRSLGRERSNVEDRLQWALRAIYDNEALKKIAIENKIGTQDISGPEPFQASWSQRQWPPLRCPRALTNTLKDVSQNFVHYPSALPLLLATSGIEVKSNRWAGEDIQ